MGRRRRRVGREEALIELIVPVVALSFLHPGTRQLVGDIAGAFVAIIILALLGLITYAILKAVKRHSQATEAALDAQVRVYPLPAEWSNAGETSSDERYKLSTNPDERYMPPEARTSGPTLGETLARAEAALQTAARPFIDRGNSSTQPVTRVPLADQLRSIDWFQFEKLMEVLYRKQGYIVERRGGANPDGGIDLVIAKDLERIAVQCKHWKKWDIGVPKIRELIGAMADAKIQKGILVTISDYTNDAKVLADRNHVEIVNHVALICMLERLDAHCDPEIQDLLNDTRKFCPTCERLMELKMSKRGSKFWSCTGFPRYCRHSEPIRTSE